MAGILVPIFTENADLQASLAKQYEAEAADISKLFGHAKMQSVRTLDGLKGKGFQFTVTPLQFTASDNAEENGYKAPVGSRTITLKTKGNEDTIVVRSNGPELEVVNPADDSIIGASSNPARVELAIQTWRVNLEEVRGFDAGDAIEKASLGREKRASGGPRVEKK